MVMVILSRNDLVSQSMPIIRSGRAAGSGLCFAAGPYVAKTRWQVKVARIAAVAATFFVSFEFCAPAVKPFMPKDGSDVDPRQLWEEPKAIASRDMIYGPWGRRMAPDASATYTFVHSKVHGTSPG